MLPGEGRIDRHFTVSIKWIASIPLQSLRQALQGKVRGIPYQSVQAIDVVMRHLPSIRYFSFIFTTQYKETIFLVSNGATESVRFFPTQTLGQLQRPTPAKNTDFRLLSPGC